MRNSKVVMRPCFVRSFDHSVLIAQVEPRWRHGRRSSPDLLKARARREPASAEPAPSVGLWQLDRGLHIVRGQLTQRDEQLRGYLRRTVLLGPPGLGPLTGSNA